MLGQDGQNHDLKLRTLRLVNGDRVGQFQLGKLLPLILDLALIRGEADAQSQIRVVHLGNPADVPVEHAQIIVVAPVNDPVAAAEKPLAEPDLGPPLLRRIDRLLEHLVQRARAETAPVHRREHLNLAVRAAVFGNPLRIEPPHRIRRSQAVVER